MTISPDKRWTLWAVERPQLAELAEAEEAVVERRRRRQAAASLRPQLVKEEVEAVEAVLHHRQVEVVAFLEVARHLTWERRLRRKRRKSSDWVLQEA
jgi:hypothetical protein